MRLKGVTVLMNVMAFVSVNANSTGTAGNRYLGNYQSDEQQYMALMNRGLTYASQWDLRPGIALTPDQIAQLTSDMVWLVTQEVTLADGSRQSVLVPQVYVRVKPGDLDGSGALLAGRVCNILCK